jgi:uncharacterized protein with von Willebrand factor type A (vWA) domain
MNAGGGGLSASLVAFGRALRRAGMPIGTGQLLDATLAVDVVGVERREDVYWALAATLVRRREELVVFRELFDVFFRDPETRDIARALFEQSRKLPTSQAERAAARRVRDALAERARREERAPRTRDRVELDVTMSASPVESLATRDFESMSASEIALAEEAIRAMDLTWREHPTRRLVPSADGPRVDLRRTLRAALRTGGHDIPLRFRERATRPPPIVVLCDVSGSMERYSRMLLHFTYALGRARARVTSFVFGTRLTNVTRSLAARDVDEALARVGRDVLDWSGGTRIGESLRAFNKRWSRRVLGQGAIVLLITDGLERDPPALLGHEAARLGRSCRRLVWLNPLLRYDGFEPLAAGVRELLPHVSEHRKVHNLASLRDLADALDAPHRARQ